MELNHADPVVLMVYEGNRVCQKCNDYYWLKQEGAEDVCVSCCLIKSERDFIILFGWRIMRSARQMVMTPA